jgi:hypothetical protein
VTIGDRRGADRRAEKRESRVYSLPPAATLTGRVSGDRRLIGHSPDRAVAVFAYKQRTILCDRNADRAAPDLVIPDGMRERAPCACRKEANTDRVPLPLCLFRVPIVCHPPIVIDFLIL